MKTELITNVSHDLKTPLTAIITYVNLLKDEKDEEKRKDYIDILERKSMRLKVLIEDLFEISKASSQNVKLNLMNVDIVNLFKQVKFELEDKFEEKGLEFRTTFPEEKVILRLDSQKTYRIFENLLNNIVKYALPGTRVYVEIEKTEKDVFNPPEKYFCNRAHIQSRKKLQNASSAEMSPAIPKAPVLALQS